MNSGTTKKIFKRPRANSDDEDNINAKCCDDNLADDEEQRLKGKAAEKSNKKFSIALVKFAVSCEWEEHDLARLVFLILKERQLNSKKTLRLLQSCSICTPTVFSTLRDADVEFSCTEIIGHLYDQAQHVDRFIQVIEDSFEQNLLNLKDTATVDALFNAAENSMNVLQFRRFARILCDHAQTKKLCGRVLNTFACRMSASEACSFICDVVSYDFFMDLSGDMKQFYKEMPEIADEIESLLASTRNMDEDGNFIDSDEDERGNLRGFIDDDMGDEHTGHIKKDKNKRARKKRFAEESSADSDSDDSRNSSIKSGKNGKHCQSNYVDYGSEDSADFSGSENSDVEDEEEEEEHEKFQFYEDRNGSKADYEIDIASGSDSPDTEPEEEEEEDDESDGDDDTNDNDNDSDDKAVLQLLNAKSLSKSISTLNNEEIQEIQNKEIDIGAKSKTPLSKSALKRLKKRNASGNITIKSEKSVSDDALAEANSSVALNDTKAEPVELNANDSIVKSESVETEEVELSKKNNVVRAAATQRKRRVIDDDDDSD